MVRHQVGRACSYSAVVVESVFAWPGLGRLILESIGNRDYTTVQGTLLVFVAMFVLVNLLTDLAYGWADPRVRVGRRVSG